MGNQFAKIRIIFFMIMNVNKINAECLISMHYLFTAVFEKKIEII